MPEEMTAQKALDLLPSIYQSVGKWEIAASRCNPDSKEGQRRWAERDKLLNRGEELMGIIRLKLQEKS